VGCQNLKILLYRYKILFTERDASEFPGIRSIPQLIVDGNTVEISPGFFVRKMKELGVM
jgi:hypothetical protein